MAAKYKYTKANVHETREKVFQFIKKYIEEKSYSPSVRDICNGVGIKSTSTVHNHLNHLNKDGRITYSDGKRRAIVIPEQESSKNQFKSAPLLGQITAGSPILANENIEDYIPVPEYFDKYQDVYALRIKGDSMQDVAIVDGDIVFVEKKNTAQFGDIIVGLIEDEATVKELGVVKGRPYLFPKNSAYSPIPFFSDDCKILGIVRGVLRVTL
ncbi:MAG: transcriptional repressor LexA [Clostridiaceae bacterium]|nr:transcriptional repressor LexA [Clostridiaceae bacterium]